jgi:hypothetical protein
VSSTPNASTAHGSRICAAAIVDALSAWTPEERETLGALLLRLVDDLQRTPHRRT